MPYVADKRTNKQRHRDTANELDYAIDRLRKALNHQTLNRTETLEAHGRIRDLVDDADNVRDMVRGYSELPE
jgi:hypothetical protein